MRRLGVVILAIVAVLILAVVSLPFLINPNRFRPEIESQLSKALGRDVKIGDLKLGLFSGNVTASNVSIADDPAFSRMPFLQTQGLKLSVDVWPAVFSHRLNVRGITIDRPEIALIQTPSGNWNFSSLGTNSATQQKPASSTGKNMALSVEALNINNARVSLKQSGQTKVLDPVNIQVRDFAPGSASPFSMTATVAGGGVIAMDGKAGPVNSSDASATPFSANVKVTNLNLVGSGAVPASSGIAGIVSVDGTGNSDGRTFAMTGKVKADKVKVRPGGTVAPNPLLFDVALKEDIKQRSGQMSRGDLALGGVKAALTGTWTQPAEWPVLNMKVVAPGVPVPAIVQLLPAMGMAPPAGTTLEGGTASANLALTGPVSTLVIAGPVSVQNTQLKGFDLGTRMAPIAKLAGVNSGSNMQIQTLSANLRMAPDGTNLHNINLVVPSLGQMTGNGTISPNQALDFKMQAAVHTAVLGSAVTASNIPFSVDGTQSNPQFHPDMGAIARQEINRGLKGVKIPGDTGNAVNGVLQGILGGKK